MARPEIEGDEDVVAVALQQFGVTLATRDEASLANFETFAGLNNVQQLVLNQYEREILDPRRQVWAAAIQKLGEGPFTGWNPNNDTLWWEFAAPQMQEVGGRMVHVSAVITAEIPHNAQTKPGMALVRNLRGDYMLENEVMGASKELEIPLPQSYIARKLHREPKKTPSLDAQHQAAGEALLQHATQLTATVYATPAGGEKERLVYTSMQADALVRPASIMATFARPRGYFGGQQVELTERNTGTFLERWKEDPVIRSDKPDLESLDTFLRKQLTWGGTYSAFNSALATVSGCNLQTTIGKPQYVARRKRQGVA